MLDMLGFWWNILHVHASQSSLFGSARVCPRASLRSYSILIAIHCSRASLPTAPTQRSSARAATPERVRSHMTRTACRGSTSPYGRVSDCLTHVRQSGQEKDSVCQMPQRKQDLGTPNTTYRCDTPRCIWRMALTLPTRRPILPPYSVALASPAAPPHRAHRGICRATATGAFIATAT